MPRSTTAAVVACALAAPSIALAGGNIFLPTNAGNGADAEVRESNPDQNRGTSTELATRVRDAHSPDDGTGSDPFDRNSVIYLQFDLTQVDSVLPNAILRMTYRNNNLTEDRIHDTDAMLADLGNNGFEYYGIPNTSFNETTITYNNAPGMTPDGDVGTVDFNDSAMFLGDLDLPDIGTQSHLPIGGTLDFTSALLDAFLADQKENNRLAVIAIVRRNEGLTYNDTNATKTGDEPPAWSNFNYLFNPKEQTTLNNDDTYDANVNDDNNPLGGPHSGADNSTGTYSPQLVFIPAPATTLALLAPATILTRRRR